MIPTSPSTAAGATLLVVDDNEMNRDMLTRRLEQKGYRLLTACDGPSALDLLAREPVDAPKPKIRSTLKPKNNKA